MAVLIYLAERPGQVVSREALLTAVWSGLVVSDDSLTQVIIKLRKALGDAAEKPAYIQTIPKGGYRLVAPVVRLEPKRRVPWTLGAGVVGALLLAAAAAWWIHGERLTGARPDRPAIEGTQAAQPTVTIRPFEALGNDPQAVLLARGMTADLVTDLSKLSGLSVIGVASSVDATAAKPSEAPPLRYLVSGSVQRIDDRLRLHIHLTDAQTGKQLWSERFDRAVSSFFTIQEELGPKILQVLPAKVSEAEMRRVAQRHTRSLEAYEYFQRGQAALLVRQK